MGSTFDVNGDRVDDLVVGAGSWDTRGAGANVSPGDAGAVYVFLGGPRGIAAKAAAERWGKVPFGHLGGAVASAGDVNGDGFADVIVGADSSQRAFLFAGSSEGLSEEPVTTLQGHAHGASFGESVAGAGDVDGDGFADVVVGDYWARTLWGEAYVYLGSRGGISLTPAVTLTDENTSGRFGMSLASLASERSATFR